MHSWVCPQCSGWLRRCKAAHHLASSGHLIKTCGRQERWSGTPLAPVALKKSNKLLPQGSAPNKANLPLSPPFPRLSPRCQSTFCIPELCSPSRANSPLGHPEPRGDGQRIPVPTMGFHTTCGSPSLRKKTFNTSHLSKKAEIRAHKGETATSS